MDINNIKIIKEREKIRNYIDPNKLIKINEKQWKTISPFTNETNPSFFIKEVDGVEIFKDFSSGYGGDIFTFLQIKEKKSFLEILRELEKKHNLVLNEKNKKKKKTDLSEYYEILSKISFFSYQNLLGNQEILNYLKSRNLNENDIQLFNLGWLGENDLFTIINSYNFDKAKLIDLGLIIEKNQKIYTLLKNKITIPLYDEKNNIIGISARKYFKEDNGSKYLNPTNNILYKKNSYIFGLNLAKDEIKKNNFVIITEGYFDFIQLYKNNIKNSIAIAGTSLMNEQVKILKKYTNKFYFCFDGDIAGINSIIRNSKEPIKEEIDIYIIELPKGEDPDSFIIKNSKEEFNKLINNAKHIIDYIKSNEDILIEYLEGLQKIIPKIKSPIKQELWYKNILEKCKINLKKNIKEEFFLLKNQEELTENDIIFIKTFINTDDEGKKLLLQNKFYETDKAKYFILKYINKTYKIKFSEEDKNIINMFKINKTYDIDYIKKIINKKKEELKLNING